MHVAMEGDRGLPGSLFVDRKTLAVDYDSSLIDFQIRSKLPLTSPPTSFSDSNLVDRLIRFGHRS